MWFILGYEISVRQSRVLRGNVICESTVFHFVLNCLVPGDYIFITFCLTLTSSIKQVCVSVGAYPGRWFFMLDGERILQHSQQNSRKLQTPSLAQEIAVWFIPIIS